MLRKYYIKGLFNTKTEKSSDALVNAVTTYINTENIKRSDFDKLLTDNHNTSRKS
jgi:hypothetical protein